MRWLVLALLLTGCGATAPTPVTRTIEGTFTLVAQDGVFAGNNCGGSGGYEDIRQGMGLTLKDGEGTVIGSDSLSRGTPSDDRHFCEFTFTFEDVPDADFYVLDGGRRGEQTYSRADLEAADWTVSLTIGE